jgi:hypothetical protein
MSEGKKNDEGKVRMDLLPRMLLEGTATVLTFGAGKYGDHNWRSGLAYSRVYAALQRHLVDWWDGEELDKETGKSHLWHASCCLAFLMEYQAHGRYGRFDDRYWKEVKQNEKETRTETS